MIPASVAFRDFLFGDFLVIDFDHSEALLFRMLSSFFGGERVIPKMSVLAVCGGELPGVAFPEVQMPFGFDLRSWAKQSKCLFTVVDGDDNPKLVVEFFSGFSDYVSNHEVEHQRYLKPLLGKLGIAYVTISTDEFDEVLDPDSSLDFCSLLHSKVEPETSSA